MEVSWERFGQALLKTHKFQSRSWRIRQFVDPILRSKSPADRHLLLKSKKLLLTVRIDDDRLATKKAKSPPMRTHAQQPKQCHDTDPVWSFCSPVRYLAGKTELDG